MIGTAARRVRRVIRRVGHARELQRRRPPRLRFDPRPSGRRVVYYLCPDDNTPSGGIRMLYRHVDTLTKAGVEAKILHRRPGFRCDWFANTTPVTSATEAVLHADDLLVVPEYYGPGLSLLPSGVRKIVFNQNAYQTFDHIPLEGTAPKAPYADLPGLVALATVSEDNAALLRYTFDPLPVHLTRVVVDRRLFHPPDRPAGQRIAFMPRRRADEQRQLLHILRARDALAGWELVPIDGLSESETARMLRTCAVFLSFSDREGFGLPPAEAMASGCYVIGYTGLAGREFFDPRYCVQVPENDLLAYAIAVETTLRDYASDRERFIKAGLLASETILGRYHEEGLREDLLRLLATVD